MTEPELLDDLLRRRRIGAFAAAYVRVLGFTGEDSASVEQEAIQKLDAGELLDDAELVKRARRHQRNRDLLAQGLTQEEIDKVDEQLYGTTAGDTYRGQISRFLEMVLQGDDSARQRVQEQLDAASKDDQVTPEQYEALKRFVRDTLREGDD